MFLVSQSQLEIDVPLASDAASGKDIDIYLPRYFVLSPDMPTLPPLFRTPPQPPLSFNLNINSLTREHIGNFEFLQ